MNAREVTITRRFMNMVRDIDPEIPVISRQDWGSNPNGRRWPLAPDVDDVYAWRRVNRPHLLPERRSDTLVMHITVTRDDGPTIGDFKADMREVERIGFQRFGAGFPYNMGVGHGGELGVGQSLDAAGTHTVNDKDRAGFSFNQNAVALAIAWIAMPGERLSAKAERTMTVAYAALIRVRALTPDPDHLPHSFFAFKDCPTDAVRAAMPRIRRNALRLASNTTPDPDPIPSRVVRARAAVEDACELLDEAPPDRTGVAVLATAYRAVSDAASTAELVEAVNALPRVALPPE